MITVQNMCELWSKLFNSNLIFLSNLIYAFLLNIGTEFLRYYLQVVSLWKKNDSQLGPDENMRSCHWEMFTDFKPNLQ